MTRSDLGVEVRQLGAGLRGLGDAELDSGSFWLRQQLTHLSEAIAGEAPSRFADFLAWQRSMSLTASESDGHEVDVSQLAKLVEGALQGEPAREVQSYIALAVDDLAELPLHPASYIDTSAPYGEVAKELLSALLTFQRSDAEALIRHQVHSEFSIADLYL